MLAEFKNQSPTSITFILLDSTGKCNFEVEKRQAAVVHHTWLKM